GVALAWNFVNEASKLGLSRQCLQETMFTGSKEQKDLCMQSLVYGFVPKSLYDRLQSKLTTPRLLRGGREAIYEDKVNREW
ncbi:36148_t:CDS:2, partial [Gigaspora margarita]